MPESLQHWTMDQSLYLKQLSFYNDTITTHLLENVETSSTNGAIVQGDLITMGTSGATSVPGLEHFTVPSYIGVSIVYGYSKKRIHKINNEIKNIK